MIFLMQMIKMMVVVVAVYTLCWLPFNILMVSLRVGFEINLLLQTGGGGFNVTDQGIKLICAKMLAREEGIESLK